MNFLYFKHYGVRVGDDFYCYNELIQTYQIVIMNFKYSKHYGAIVGDFFVAKKTTKRIKWFFKVH